MPIRSRFGGVFCGTAICGICTAGGGKLTCGIGGIWPICGICGMAPGCICGIASGLLPGADFCAAIMRVYSLGSYGVFGAGGVGCEPGFGTANACVAPPLEIGVGAAGATGIGVACGFIEENGFADGNCGPGLIGCDVPKSFENSLEGASRGGSGFAGAAPIDWNMRVNSPGSGPLGAGCPGHSSLPEVCGSGELNKRVNSPGSVPAGAAAGWLTGGVADHAGGGTSAGLVAGGAAWNSRVNSPGAAAGGGGGGGAAGGTAMGRGAVAIGAGAGACAGAEPVWNSLVNSPAGGA